MSPKTRFILREVLIVLSAFLLLGLFGLGIRMLQLFVTGL